MNKTLIVVVVAIALGGASFYAWNRFHSSDAGRGKVPATDAAGHGDHRDAVLKITHFSEKTELFVEFPPLVAGEESAFAVHLTRLADFKPVVKGMVTVALLDAGGKPVDSVSVDAPSVPGIFRPVAKPGQPGERQLVLTLDADDLKVTHDLGKVTVYPSAKAAAQAAAISHTEAGTGIAFSKEQQWQVDFALAKAERRTMRDSVAVTGTIRAEANGEALLNASAAGQIAADGVFPRVGMRVQAGQVLALLRPRLGGETDLATLEAAALKARANFEQARRERERVEALFAQEAVAEKRVFAAKTDETLARAELEASERRFGQYGGKGGGIPIRSPIAGVIGDVKVAPGASVNDGQTLFHVVNTGRLWLEARIPETEVGRIVKPTGAWFRVDGFEQTFEIVEGRNGRVVAFGGVVDAATRTVPLILEFANPGDQLRIGMAAQVHVVGSRTVDAVAVRSSAIIDDAGRSAVFVQLGGESFERRIVLPGVRDGDWVAVKSGINADERVVARGAYLVKLAASAPAVPGHGHAH